MGWGISIPALGINTGEFIHGDAGKLLGDISREADTPIGRTVIGSLVGMPGLGLTAGAAKAYENQKKSIAGIQKEGTDFNQLTSKWDQLQEDITGSMPQQAIQDLSSQSQAGVGAGLQALGQKGGQGIGAAGRLQSQSKWDVAQGAAGINQNAQEMGNQFAMNKIKGVDIPVIQGKELSLAQQQAALEQGRQATGSQIGGIIGSAAGAYFGGPMGAQVGYQAGSNIGRSAWPEARG
jgi:hypothetical protein